MKTTDLQLFFGAMLHDIGKVVYRGISAKGTHSELGAAFIAEEIAVLNDGFNKDNGIEIVQQIRYHHAAEMTRTTALKNDSLVWITYFADNVSAGMDRKNEGEEEQRAQFDSTLKMRKIFNILQGRKDDNTIEHDDYNSIRETIKSGLAGIEVSARGVNSLLSLLEATTSTIPSSTDRTQLVDVSLYDHAKTTAAIAACILRYLEEQKVEDYRQALFNSDSAKEFYAKEMFLLYSMDMSGIQSFIYSISGKGALKQLRARSLYLEMMLEHIADELLNRLHLSRANLLYTGGGHAYLLLPNTDSTKQEIQSFTDELSTWFIAQHRTDLYLASDWVECSADDLANRGEDTQRYRNLYRNLSEKLSVRKASRYSAKTIADLNYRDDKMADHSRECSECHRSDKHIDDEGKCTLCAALGEVSRAFIRSNVLVVAKESKKASLPLPFDKVISLYTPEEYLKEQPEVVRVYTKNSWYTGIGLATHIWMGDYTVDTGEEGISAYAERSATLTEKLGIERLGVLRADVDNLGTVFTHGLPDDKISISRTSALSRALSYFFKKEINDILDRGSYQVQIIYSGGDDLFIIGNWSDVIHAAIDLRRALDEFTGNGILTMSAGIGMFDSRYPIARMAFEVGELESAAKGYTASGSTKPTKNAIALWSNSAVFCWDEFIKTTCARFEEVRKDFSSSEKGSAFAYRLVSLLRNEEDYVSIPRLAYLLARSFEDNKEHGTEKSRRYYGWATDEKERRHLIAALEWYLYSVREREDKA